MLSEASVIWSAESDARVDRLALRIANVSMRDCYRCWALLEFRLGKAVPPACAVSTTYSRTRAEGGISRDRAGYPPEAVVHKAADRPLIPNLKFRVERLPGFPRTLQEEPAGDYSANESRKMRRRSWFAGLPICDSEVSAADRVLSCLG